MSQKICALCTADITVLHEPALLFIGRYGRRYEICKACEDLMDTLVSSEDAATREDAAKTVYHHLFEEGEQKPIELLNFFKDLLSEDSNALLEARENLEDYEEEEEKKRLEAEKKAEDALSIAEEAAIKATDDSLDQGISEEDFLKDEEKPLSLPMKLLFLVLFLLLGGSAVAYGIFCDSVVMIVLGAIVSLIGLLTLFSKN